MKHLFNITVFLGCLIISACGNRNNNPARDSTRREKDTLRENAQQQNPSGRNIPDSLSVSAESGDKGFVRQAADAGLSEVSLGKLASKKGTSASIRDFGAMMVKDHDAANSELKSLASKKNIQVPDSLCGKCREKLESLSRLKGNDFDKRYAEMMVSDHEEAIRQFEAQSSQGKDADLKAWADGKLPALRHHLEKARSLKK